MIDLGQHFALVRLFMPLRSSLCILLLSLLCGPLHAQFSSTIRCLKKGHLIGEPVMVRVSITNYTGKEQVLHGERIPWITFLVKTSNGNPVHARRTAPAKPVRIGAGQTLARDFNLAGMFQLNREGNYSVSAIIRPPNESVEGSSTNRDRFELRSGRTYWAQKVGGVGRQDGTRTFRVLQFSEGGKTQLYLQVTNEDTGRTIRTARLGDVLMLRKPSCLIDAEQHLHILFLTTPNTWLHYRVSPEGEIEKPEMHRRAAVGDPRLTATADGMILVTNSILYDPELAAKQRAEIRRITDRP